MVYFIFVPCKKHIKLMLLTFLSLFKYVCKTLNLKLENRLIKVDILATIYCKTYTSKK